jgi:phage host-nuclease inhibitor protein Gam
MAKAAKKKTFPIPRDKEELEEFVIKIRHTIVKVDRIEAETNIEIAKLEKQIDELKKKAQSKAKPLQSEINELAAGVFCFATDNRSELTEEEKKKTVEFSTGDKIRWYFTRPSVVVGDEAEAIAELERLKLKKLIRIKKEINREEILKAPEVAEKLENISVEQDEIFAIVPAEMGIELQKGKKKFKKVAL